jgi:hypothetical protein
MVFAKTGPHHVRAGVEGKGVDKVVHFTVVDVPVAP